MKVAIMQPYFFPYLGYLQLMAAVDRFVIYDDVNYIKGGWINRNRVLINGEPHYFTLEAIGASPNRKITEVSVGRNRDKLLTTLRMAYGRAPQFAEVMTWLGPAIRNPEPNLAKYLIALLRSMADVLGIRAEILVSSELGIATDQHGQERVVEIAARLGADTYVNASGGRALYQTEAFANRGMALKFLEMRPLSYRQGKQDFVPNLSIIDVLMMNDGQRVRALLGEFELVGH